VIKEIRGIEIRTIESGKSLSNKINPWVADPSSIPFKVTFITDPDLLIKFKKLPFRNNIDNTVVNKRYND
jgi:hypothetical protein